MFDLNTYLADLIQNCQSAFGKRLLYVGLQGSYLRGEAHEGSDIDVMTILDRFSVRDMDTYRGILKKIGFYEKSCGFICGKEEMNRWNPLEVCQLRHTTRDLLGVLTDYLPPATREDEINYVKLSLGNLYHELCHRYIHADRDKNVAKFRGACKSAFYLIQNLHFLESGRFILSRKELKEAAVKEDRMVLELAELPDDYDFDQAFASLFAWCQRAFERVEDLSASEHAAKRERVEMMRRPITTLFMLMSVDGKISTGATDELDVDRDFPEIAGLREGLRQYYEIEQTTDLWSFNTGRVQAKMGVNTAEMPAKTPVSFVLLDNHHLDEQGVRYFCAKSKQFVLITTNRDHPAFEVSAENLHIIFQEELSLSDALSDLKEEFGCERLTVQSGGTVNCLFLHEKLFDYVDLVVAPVLIGGKDTATLIDGRSLRTKDELAQLGVLRLVEASALEDSYVRLRYQVIC